MGGLRRRASSRVSSFCAAGLCAARSFSCSRRFSSWNAGRVSGFLSWLTTPTAREASSTWTTGWRKWGAIFTAVCTRLVVAPPMSSGMVNPSRSISLATWTISSSEGVMSPLKPIMSACVSRAVCRIFSHGTITPRSIIS